MGRVCIVGFLIWLAGECCPTPWDVLGVGLSGWILALTVHGRFTSRRHMFGIRLDIANGVGSFGVRLFPTLAAVESGEDTGWDVHGAPGLP